MKFVFLVALVISYYVPQSSFDSYDMQEYELDPAFEYDLDQSYDDEYYDNAMDQDYDDQPYDNMDSYYEDQYDLSRVPSRQESWASFKNTISRGVSAGVGAVKNAAGNAVRKVGNFMEQIQDKLFGSFPARLQQYLKSIGNSPLSNLAIYRFPIKEAFSKIIHAVDGNVKNELNKAGYDKFFHTWLSFTADGKTYGIEKNSVVRMFDGTKQGESLPIGSPGGITLNSLLSNAIKQKGENRILNYDPIHANCQQFVKDILSSAGILPSSAESFFYQNAINLMSKNTKKLNPVTSAGTRIVGWVDRAIQHVTKGKVELPTYEDELDYEDLAYDE